jgi:hypothetical protein
MRNLRTDREAALSAMAQIEGQEWLDKGIATATKQSFMGEGPLLGAFNALAEVESEYEEAPSEVIYVIYGRDGWNRWIVRADGRVELSQHHSRKEVVGVAKALGFRIFL